MAIVEAIFGMAAALKLDVIAEGVERHEQLDCLCSRNCHEMQGYIFSPPLNAAEAEKLMRANVSNVTNVSAC